MNNRRVDNTTALIILAVYTLIIVILVNLIGG